MLRVGRDINRRTVQFLAGHASTLEASDRGFVRTPADRRAPERRLRRPLRRTARSCITPAGDGIAPAGAVVDRTGRRFAGIDLQTKPVRLLADARSGRTIPTEGPTFTMHHGHRSIHIDAPIVDSIHPFRVQVATVRRNQVVPQNVQRAEMSIRALGPGLSFKAILIDCRGSGCLKVFSEQIKVNNPSQPPGTASTSSHAPRSAPTVVVGLPADAQPQPVLGPSSTDPTTPAQQIQAHRTAPLPAEPRPNQPQNAMTTTN